MRLIRLSWWCRVAWFSAALGLGTVERFHFARLTIWLLTSKRASLTRLRAEDNHRFRGNVASRILSCQRSVHLDPSHGSSSLQTSISIDCALLCSKCYFGLISYTCINRWRQNIEGNPAGCWRIKLTNLHDSWRFIRLRCWRKIKIECEPTRYTCLQVQCLSKKES